jgi:hypothetical protein
MAHATMLTDSHYSHVKLKVASLKRDFQQPDHTASTWSGDALPSPKTPQSLRFKVHYTDLLPNVKSFVD